MITIHTITAANGAIVHVELNHIDGDDAAAIAVAQACIDANTYDFDEPGDIYEQQTLTGLLSDLWHDKWGTTTSLVMDEANDGAHSAHRIDIGGHTALWHSGISSDPCLSICAEGTTIEKWVRSWDEGARVWAESWGFGWDDGSAEVSEDFYGEVVIQVTPHFYNGTLGNGTTPHLLRDDDGNVVVFDSVSDAQEWIDGQNQDVYVLSHGEYASPDYTILDASIARV